MVRAWHVIARAARAGEEMIGTAGSKEIVELLNAKPRLLENVGQCGSQHRAVGGNRQLQRFLNGLFLKPDVAALLSHNHPAITAQCFDDLVVRQARDLHTDISIFSILSENSESSSTGSR